jgi:hypothetical protein
MEFIEAPAFSRYISGYLEDDDYRALQNHLGLGPDAGDLILGTGGFRKIRWDHQVWLMTLYGKNEAADLTPVEKKALKAAIESECKAREAARRKR